MSVLDKIWTSDTVPTIPVTFPVKDASHLVVSGFNASTVPFTYTQGTNYTVNIIANPPVGGTTATVVLKAALASGWKPTVSRRVPLVQPDVFDCLLSFRGLVGFGATRVNSLFLFLGFCSRTVGGGFCTDSFNTHSIKQIFSGCPDGCGTKAFTFSPEVEVVLYCLHFEIVIPRTVRGMEWVREINVKRGYPFPQFSRFQAANSIYVSWRPRFTFSSRSTVTPICMETKIMVAIILGCGNIIKW